MSVHISGMKLSDGELPIAASSDNPETAPETYAGRWQIGTMSACPKTEGSGSESTHPGDPERIGKLSGFVTISSVRAYLVGDHPDGISPVPDYAHFFIKRLKYKFINGI